MRIVLALIVTSAGCAATDPPPAGYPVGLGTATDPLPNADGYDVQSRVVMPIGNANVDAAITRMQSFSTAGGATLLAAGAGTPSGQVLAALPSALRAQLAGWIDVELDKQHLGTATMRQALGDIATMAHTIANGFTLESNLSITPTGALHSLTDLNFRPDALDVVVPIGDLMADEITQRPTSQVGAGGALEVGDEHFALALGNHAWKALDLAVGSKYGGNLTAVQQLDCRAVAQAVAARCISGTCVGHQSDVLAVCQAGMTALVADLSDALSPIVLDAHFIAGTAKLVDANGDGIAESLSGTWEAENDVGLGATSMEIAFTAAVQR
jgi:hypothetical protein